jgi:hypothetical protein
VTVLAQAVSPPQDGDRGRPVHERDVGVPGVGLAPAGLGVQLEDVRLRVGAGHGGVGRGQVAEQPGEPGLPVVGQVVLTVEEDDLVLVQRVLDQAENVAGKIGGQPYAGDFGADVARDAPDVDTRFSGGHEAPS